MPTVVPLLLALACAEGFTINGRAPSHKSKPPAPLNVSSQSIGGEAAVLVVDDAATGLGSAPSSAASPPRVRYVEPSFTYIAPPQAANAVDHGDPLGLLMVRFDSPAQSRQHAARTKAHGYSARVLLTRSR